MSAVILAMITAVVGALFGFVITRVNDWLRERHETRRARRHLLTEASNVVRHYSVMRDKLNFHETEQEWRDAINLETCRFYGNGLGTFDLSSLRLFDEPLAEEALFLLLMIRNNNLYVDQGKTYVVSQDLKLFHAVCTALATRCNTTIDRAKHLEAMLRDGPQKVERIGAPSF